MASSLLVLNIHVMEQRLDNDNLNVISRVHFPNLPPGMQGASSRMKPRMQASDFAGIRLPQIGLNQGLC